MSVAGDVLLVEEGDLLLGVDRDEVGELVLTFGDGWWEEEVEKLSGGMC